MPIGYRAIHSSPSFSLLLLSVLLSSPISHFFFLSVILCSLLPLFVVSFGALTISLSSLPFRCFLSLRPPHLPPRPPLRGGGSLARGIDSSMLYSLFHFVSALRMCLVMGVSTSPVLSLPPPTVSLSLCGAQSLTKGLAFPQPCSLSLSVCVSVCVSRLSLSLALWEGGGRGALPFVFSLSFFTFFFRLLWALMSQYHSNLNQLTVSTVSRISQLRGVTLPLLSYSFALPTNATTTTTPTRTVSELTSFSLSPYLSLSPYVLPKL